jgi:hypothetical protein
MGQGESYVRSHTKASCFGRRRTLPPISVTLFLALAVFAFASAPASAATGRSWLRSFSIGAGKNPASIAADSAGNVYVLELTAAAGGVQAVAKFDSQGDPVDFSASAGYVSGNKLTGAPSEPFANPVAFLGSHVAVDNSGGPTDGYIYVVANFSRGGGVYAFAPSGEYKGFLQDPQFSGLYVCGVGVRQSTGEVYMTNVTSSVVTRFSPLDSSITGQLQTGREHPCAIAVDSTGTVYIGGARYLNVSPFGVMKYSASEMNSGAGAGEEIEPTPVSQVAVDPASDDVLLGLANRVVERAPSGAFVGDFGFPAYSSGVGVGGNEAFVLDESGAVSVFGSATSLPKAETRGSSNVIPISASVQGEADPDGAGEVTGCEFRYGTDTTYSEGSAPCVPAGPIAAATAVSANLTGLHPETTYHYSLFIENSNGVQVGRDHTLTTPPAVAAVTTG